VTRRLKNCPTFYKAAKNAKKAQFESPKQLHQTTFETLKQLQQTMF
jgi:hypothetical protein